MTLFPAVYGLVIDLCDLLVPFVYPFFGIGLILYVIHLLIFLIGGKSKDV